MASSYSVSKRISLSPRATQPASTLAHRERGEAGGEEEPVSCSAFHEKASLVNLTMFVSPCRLGDVRYCGSFHQASIRTRGDLY